MDYKKIIEEKNGTFIKYIKKKDKNGYHRTYIEFICENGHETIKRPWDLKKTWCNECQKNTKEKVQQLAKNKGFKLLSKYVNANTKYKWECKNGHIFESKYSNVHAGKGCPECLRVPYEYFEKLCKDKGGKLLTLKKYYKGVGHKITMECEEGHIWSTVGASLKRGTWCAKCNESLGERTCMFILNYIFDKQFLKSYPKWLCGLELDGYNEELQLAFEYNGMQHYKHNKYWFKTDKQFQEQLDKDKFRVEMCEMANIELIIIPYTIKYEDIYTYIYNELDKKQLLPDNISENIDYNILNITSNSKSKLHTIEKYVEEKFKGKTISKNYINAITKYDFECKNGHKFKQTWGCIKEGIFCKICNGQPLRNKMTQSILDHCEKYNLLFLSEYKTSRTKYNFQCLKCSKTFTKSWDNMRNKKNPCCN